MTDILIRSCAGSIVALAITAAVVVFGLAYLQLKYNRYE